MGAIDAPLLCVLADQGLPLPHNMHDRLDAVPQARFLVVEGGHHVHLDDPEKELMPVLLSFFRDGPDDASAVAAATNTASELKAALASKARL